MTEPTQQSQPGHQRLDARTPSPFFEQTAGRLEEMAAHVTSTDARQRSFTERSFPVYAAYGTSLESLHLNRIIQAATTLAAFYNQRTLALLDDAGARDRLAPVLLVHPEAPETP